VERDLSLCNCEQNGLKIELGVYLLIQVGYTNEQSQQMTVIKRDSLMSYRIIGFKLLYGNASFYVWLSVSLIMPALRLYSNMKE
jgi:hypothetical protein